MAIKKHLTEVRERRRCGGSREWLEDKLVT
jgi:hypothetical protein